MTSEMFEVTRRGPVLKVELNRPEKRNALTFKAEADWDAILDMAEEDDEIRAVTLSGRGPVFSSGHDLSEVSADFAAGRQPEGAKAKVPHLPRAWYFRKPILAGVHGFVGPAANSLLTMADFIIAVAGTRFSYEQTRSGGNSGRSESLMPFLVPMRALKKLFMFGGWFDAETALQWQYVQRVVPDYDAMLRELDKWADQIAMIPREEVMATKDNLRQQYELMGLASIQTVGHFIVAHGHEEDKAFYQTMQEKGLKEAIRRRDAGFDPSVAKI